MRKGNFLADFLKKKLWLFLTKVLFATDMLHVSSPNKLKTTQMFLKYLKKKWYLTFCLTCRYTLTCMFPEGVLSPILWDLAVNKLLVLLNGGRYHCIRSSYRRNLCATNSASWYERKTPTESVCQRSLKWKNSIYAHFYSFLIDSFNYQMKPNMCGSVYEAGFK